MASNVSRGIMPPVKLLDSVTGASGTGNIMDVRDFLYVQIVISTSGNAQGTVKFRGSMHGVSDVDLSAAASATNEWDYIAAYNLQNPSIIVAGDSGVVYTGTDAVEQLILNVDGVNALTAQLAWTAGNFNVTVFGYSNQ